MHYVSPFYSSFAPGFGFAFLPFLIVVALWTIVLKGLALWHAARDGKKWWFIALLVINTVGLLEIVYLIWFRKHTSRAHHSHTPAHHSSPQA